MSYSRWSNSNWYAFWDTMSGDEKNEQVLSLSHVSSEIVPNFYYDELVDIKASSLPDIYEIELSKKDIAEAMDIIKLFLSDVNEEYAYEDRK